MIPDSADTIVAISSAAGEAARGIIRVSGPNSVSCLDGVFQQSEASPPLDTIRRAKRLPGKLTAILGASAIDCELFHWPDQRSFTRQSTVELHTLGSTFLLEAVVERICLQGARLAVPGEFTLRAFLAGRLDLTQAEAVLGVIDAQDPTMLAQALSQLAGGMSQPLSQLKNSLVNTLAELEAGLDFVDEDIEFVSAETVIARLTNAVDDLDGLITSLNERSVATGLPRVVLVGAPNAGKSSLFNTLLSRSEQNQPVERALVTSQAGTTRDYLSGEFHEGKLHCILFDTAGKDSDVRLAAVEKAAQKQAAAAHSQADCRILCVEAGIAIGIDDQDFALTQSNGFKVATKADLLPDHHRVSLKASGWVVCSCVDGMGLESLTARIAESLASSNSGSAMVPSTQARCQQSLRGVRDALQRALEACRSGAGEELVASELRLSLNEIGGIVGTVYTDDILDRIFSQFCIGK